MAVEQKPLMPKATAVWLVDNTSLSFEQIAEFCGLHPLEVKGIADEDVAKGIKGQDPVTSGQLTREAIEAAEKNPKLRLKMAAAKHKMPNVKLKKAPRYTPVSKRQDKPDAVYWIIRNHPEFADADIIKLIGTTKATIQKIRERSHWNAPNIKAVDPVTLGLCSQLELDLAVSRASAKHERALKRAAKKGATLRPIGEAAEPVPEAAAETTEGATES
ncbi:MAG TPA: cell cycle transcriptional regulator TrcR [Rhizomicrobium sp.]